MDVVIIGSLRVGWGVINLTTQSREVFEASSQLNY